MRAVFKPRVEGDAEGWHRAPIEWVAYELNLMLGMDYVPPVAYRQASGWERAVECGSCFDGALLEGRLGLSCTSWAACEVSN